MGKRDKIVLKRGREKPIKERHHWLFSGAVAALPSVEEGSIVPVESASGELLGEALFNPRSSIVGRMVSFGDRPPLEEIKKNIREACHFRLKRFDQTVTNAFRAINGEGDSLSGLVVDKYGDLLVLQIFSLGMDKLKDLIVQELISIFHPRAIYEKSLHGSRLEEGLQKREGLIYGAPFGEITIVENGIRFLVDPVEGQKSGFFLDQREMRRAVFELSKGKRVLNCFSYTGGFSLYALKGGAESVTSVESSAPALALANRNLLLNNIPLDMHTAVEGDVFQYLQKNPLDFDFVILDPPAFAKKRGDLAAATKGYRNLNRLALEKMAPESLLLTCSCSGYISPDLFQKTLFQAAVAAGRRVRIVGRHELASDHPINIYHPETEYLKSLLLYVT